MSHFLLNQLAVVPILIRSSVQQLHTLMNTFIAFPIVHCCIHTHAHSIFQWSVCAAPLPLRQDTLSICVQCAD